MAPQAQELSIPDYETEYMLATAIEEYHAQYAAELAGDLAPIFYATYKGLPVQAMLVGSWAVLTTTETSALTVSAGDPALVLAGRKDLADAQRQNDAAQGGFAAIVCRHNGTREGR
jgi:hypothetical protein